MPDMRPLGYGGLGSRIAELSKQEALVETITDQGRFACRQAGTEAGNRFPGGSLRIMMGRPVSPQARADYLLGTFRQPSALLQRRTRGEYAGASQR